MFIDFYATVAQVLPVLLLAFLWDSGFLHRLRDQRGPTRTAYCSGPSRVCVYSLVVAPPPPPPPQFCSSSAG